MNDREAQPPILKPLTRSTRNPRYFCDHEGRAVYLAGSHTWANLQDIRLPGDPPFDYEAWLAMMLRHGHNFMRLWQWMLPSHGPWTPDTHTFDPLPYPRTGPGAAADGEPRFDLDRWNEAYFQRLRHRVGRALACGIYTSVMLFDAWCLRYSSPGLDGWAVHPFHGDNNVNGVHGGSNGGNRCDLYTLEDPAVSARLVAFVRKVIDTVGDLDNVLYEIVNEMPFDPRGYEWHCAMVEEVRRYERGRGTQHPVGMSDDGNGFNAALAAGPADWIAPGAGRNGEYRYDPPVADGGKVVVSDTDHLWGHGGTSRWAWKAFLRGHNTLFMDPWQPIPGRAAEGYCGQGTLNTRDYPDWELLRATLGETRRISHELDLDRAVPRPDLCSTGYCLADPGRAYAAYAPEDQSLKVRVRGPATYAVRWIGARDLARTGGEPLTITADTEVHLVSPVGHDVVLILERQG